MGKNMNLNNLTPEEAQKILEVIQKDFEVRQREKERLSKIEEDIQEEENRASLLQKNTNFNKNCCIRCCEAFGIIFNRKQTCRKCQLFVCKACCHYDDSVKGYYCKVCLKDVELKTKSFDWFYKNVSEKFKRFGSAKVVRSLYKHADVGHSKYHSDNESDSGYDPSLYNSFGQSGSLRMKSRPSLTAVFPDIIITDDQGQELDNGLIPPPLLTATNNNVYQKSPPTPTLDNRTPTINNRTQTFDYGSQTLDNQTQGLNNRTRSFSQSTSGTQTPLPENGDFLDNKEKEKRDIYREAFESTKKTEEAKFKVRFDNLLSDMTKSIEKQSPADEHIPDDIGDDSYGDAMTPYKRQIKDLLVSLSQRLELAVESFDESGPHSATLTSQKVRQMISKLIEDRLGETLDLTISDEAVSDLSSLSDESGEVKSFEDQIAQAVIAKIIEQHRHRLQNGGINNNDESIVDMEQQTDSSGSEEKMVNRTRNSSVLEEKNVVDAVQSENRVKNLNVCDKNKSVPNGEILDYTDGENLVEDVRIRETSTRVQRDKDLTKDSENKNIIRSRSGNSGSHDGSHDGSHIDETVIDELDTVLDDHSVSSQKQGQSSHRLTNDSQRNIESSHRDISSYMDFNGSQGTIPGSHQQNDSSQIKCDGSQRETTQHEPDEREILQREFEKLRTFAHEVVPRPLYEEIKMDEEVEPEPIEETFDRVEISHEESQEEFSSRFFTYDKVHDTEHRSLPDFSYFDDEDEPNFEFNEVDPDLLSMNLAPIAEETEEELEEDKDDETPYEQDWRGNWIFKGAQGISPYSTLQTQKKVQGSDFPEVYMTIPKPNDPYNPRIGSRDVDDISDMSENDDRDSSDGLSDEENTFYSKTSEELARITKKSRKISSGTQASLMANTSIQTEDDSEAESLRSHPLSYTSFSDSGVRSSKLDHNSSFESRTNASILKKLSEELVAAEGDDPKFEIPPMSVTIPEGEPAKVTCRVAGTQPLDVFWYHVRDEAEELENSENYEITKDAGRHQLTMYNMTQSDQGQYMCVVMNEKGRCCQYFILNVKTVGTTIVKFNTSENTQELKAPEFLKTLSDVEVAEGESVKFRVKVKGYPQPRVTWYKDGQLLSNDLNCKLEKFGNRDYLLAIESASMDEDAEYSVLAKNIAGEVRSSAQLIVEPTNKPETESTINISKNKSRQEPEPESSEPPLIPRLSYLPSSRRSSPRGVTKRSLPGATKDEQNLSNLNQKVSMTKESIGNVAEDILSSSKELSEINQSIAAMDRILEEIEFDINSSTSEDIENNNGVGTDQELEASQKFWVGHEAAENVRKATSAAMDILDSTDSVILREKKMDALATSTPRSSVTEKILHTEDVSNVGHESELDTLNKSDESHTSELSFSFSPVSSKPVSKVLDKDGDSYRQKTETQSTKNLQSQTVSPKITQNDSTAETKLKTSPDVKENENSQRKDLNGLQNSQDSDSESLFLNFGPKRENKEWYAKDFYITNTPQMQRKSSESSDKEESPRTEKQRARTEEKIYLTAGNVYNLENRVQTLADKVKAVNALSEQDKMAKLENQVASTVAKVAHSEKEVKDVEKSVSQLTNKKQPTFKSKMAPPKPRPITPPQEKPEPTFLRGTTDEKDLPESRTEFNEEEYGSIELPSVNRLKAMFGQSNEPDSSIRRVHSITARNVPKAQLEKLRKNSLEDKDQHPQNVSPRSAGQPSVNPGRATAITTGQQIKQVPEGPKQVFQSSAINGQSGHSTGAISAIQKQKPPRQNIQITQKSQSPSSSSNTQSMKITLTNSVNRPLGPVQSEPAKQTQQPIKTHIAGKAAAPQPPSQSNTPTQNVKTGNEIDTPDGRKSPKIKQGAISAMSKFWEKRFTDGTEDEEYPDLLENQ